MGTHCHIQADLCLQRSVCHLCDVLQTLLHHQEERKPWRSGLQGLCSFDLMHMGIFPSHNAPPTLWLSHVVSPIHIVVGIPVLRKDREGSCWLPSIHISRSKIVLRELLQKFPGVLQAELEETLDFLVATFPEELLVPFRHAHSLDFLFVFVLPAFRVQKMAGACSRCQNSLLTGSTDYKATEAKCPRTSASLSTTRTS